MQARITDPNGFRCAPEGHTTVTIAFGTIVDEPIAVWAVDMGKAEWLAPAVETKVVRPSERKKRR